jgi:hypothetical protein
VHISDGTIFPAADLENETDSTAVATLTELMRLSRIELCDLLAPITTILRNFPVGSVDQNNAITNLRNITRILMQRDLSLG